MWAEGERTGLRHLPCLQKPRSYHGQSLILDSGSMCRKGHSLLLHSPAGTPDTRPLRQLAPTRLRPRPPKAGPPSSRGAQGGGCGVRPRPETQGSGSQEPQFPDLYVGWDGPPLRGDTDRGGHRVHTHQITHGSTSGPRRCPGQRGAQTDRHTSGDQQEVPVSEESPRELSLSMLRQGKA